MEKISVIVPVYNVEKYLRECLDSLLAQTYENIEFILVNDGSKDNSLSILKEYEEKDERIKVYTKENGGLSDARNYGLSYATGRYIGFVDSDDSIHKDLFKKLHEIIIENNSDISMCDFLRSDEELKNEKIYVKTYNKEDIFDDVMLDKISAHSWDKLYKKELFDNIKFPIGYHFEDLAIFYLLVDKINKFSVTNEKLYNYRVSRSDSITANKLNAVFNSICISRIYREKVEFSYSKNLKIKDKVLKMAVKYNTDTYRISRKMHKYNLDIVEIREFIVKYYKDILKTDADLLKKLFCFLIKNKII